MNKKQIEKHIKFAQRYGGNPITASGILPKNGRFYGLDPAYELPEPTTKTHKEQQLENIEGTFQEVENFESKLRRDATKKANKTILDSIVGSITTSE